MSLYSGNSGTVLHGNYGYPYRGSPRRKRPSVLAVVHITGNSSLPSALGEATYSARDGSGASFTFAINRNGTVVQCLHPETQTPWTNGDLTNPISPVTQAMVGSMYNANEYCFLTVENVGYNPGSPITGEQVEALAKLIAWASKIAGLPVNRSTVLGHREFNSASRWNCPTPGDLEVFLGTIISKANELLAPQTQEINMRMREKYEEWTVVIGAVFYPLGPGIGAPLTFPEAGSLQTTSEEALPDGSSGKWRTFRRPWNGEIAWINRAYITPKAAPDAAAYNEGVKAAIERRATDGSAQIALLTDRIAKKDVVFERIGTETARLASSGKAI